jgi:hypothetical protein
VTVNQAEPNAKGAHGGADTTSRPIRGRATGLLLSVLAYGVLVRGIAQSEAPRVELIERFSTNQVIIHFNTEANKTYTLQGIECLACGGGSSNAWTNVFVAPNLPFFNHYVIVDTRTSPQRFYRLKVTD